MKTLICHAEPNHEFTHPGGRGRPPMFCPEHKPVKKPSNSSVTGVTGVTAKSEEAPVNPFIARAKQKAVENRVAKTRATNEKKAQERVQETAEAVEKEYGEIDERIARANAEYKDSFDRAKEVGKGNEKFLDIEEEFNKAWRACDTKMNGLMNMLKRKRYLENLVEQLTNPDAPKPKLVALETELDMDDPIGGRTDLGIFDEVNDIETAREQYEDEDNGALGYNDLLSNPEQYDEDNNVAEQFAHILREFDEE